MRLIDTKTLTLREFPFGNVPPYAILSHTWGAEEVTFEDRKTSGYENHLGWAKIQRFCAKSKELGFEFGWVDTCCIDKSSSAELSEAINSMFQWYKNSAKCLVYLNDLGPNDHIGRVRHCRWISRGWTLQELIAPSEVEFYDSEWNHRGSRTKHSRLLSKATGIPDDILDGSRKLQNCSVAIRLSWASRRETTRAEDIAYCLLGIFDVNMPLLYGEGKNAFRRFQEAILRQNNDLTILAWRTLSPPGLTGALADSVSSFRGCGEMYPFSLDWDISITNRGLLFSGDLSIRVVTPAGSSQAHQLYMLCLGVNSSSMEGIILVKINPNTFCRCGAGRLTPQSTRTSESSATTLVDGMLIFEHVANLHYTSFYLATSPKEWEPRRVSVHRDYGLRIPEDPALSIKSVTPHRLYDVAHRMFLQAKAWRVEDTSPQIIGLRAEYSIQNRTFDLLILVENERYRLSYGIQPFEQCPRPVRRAFHQVEVMESHMWPDVNMEETDKEKVGRIGDQYVDVVVEGIRFRISVVLRQQWHNMSTNPLPQPDYGRSESEGSESGGGGSEGGERESEDFPILSIHCYDITLVAEEVPGVTHSTQPPLPNQTGRNPKIHLASYITGCIMA